MCGIMGTSQITDVTRQMLPILAWEMESRGRDAWGATNGHQVIKHLGPVTESWELPGDWTRGIFHTRAASTGCAKEQDNAHPFSFTKPDGSVLIGIHNGIIRKHDELNKKYNRDYQVDSMHVFAHLANGLDLKEIEGYGALAWYENDRLNFGRFNSSDLYICLLETGEIVFCSRQEPIQKSARMFGSGVKVTFKTEERVRYYVEKNSEGVDTLWESDKLPFAERYVVHSPVTSGGSEGWSYGGSYSERRTNLPGVTGHQNTSFVNTRVVEKVNPNLCIQCGVRGIDRKKALLCWICMEKELDAWRLINNGKTGRD